MNHFRNRNEILSKKNDSVATELFKNWRNALPQPKKSASPTSNIKNNNSLPTDFLSKLSLFQNSFTKQRTPQQNKNHNSPVPIKGRSFHFKREPNEGFEKWLQVRAVQIENEKLKEYQFELQRQVNDAKFNAKKPEQHKQIFNKPAGPFAASAFAFLLGAAVFNFWKRGTRKHWL